MLKRVSWGELLVERLTVNDVKPSSKVPRANDLTLDRIPLGWEDDISPHPIDLPVQRFVFEAWDRLGLMPTSILYVFGSSRWMDGRMDEWMDG